MATLNLKTLNHDHHTTIIIVTIETPTVGDRLKWTDSFTTTV